MHAPNEAYNSSIQAIYYTKIYALIWGISYDKRVAGHKTAALALAGVVAAIEPDLLLGRFAKIGEGHALKIGDLRGNIQDMKHTYPLKAFGKLIGKSMIKAHKIDLNPMPEQTAYFAKAAGSKKHA